MFKIVFVITLIFLGFSTIPANAQTFEQQLQSAKEKIEATQTTYPTGISAYGDFLNDNTIIPYEINTNGVMGIVRINSISVNPPNSGASLQLNTILHVTTTNGTTDYWLQDVIQFDDTNSQTANFLDNIWNVSDLKNTSQICAHTNPVKYVICKIMGVYYKTNTPFSYTLPFSEALAISEEIIQGKGVQIQFMHSGNGVTDTYDNKIITIPNITSASLLISNNTANYAYYDTEFVWGGIANAEIGNFNAMNSTLHLFYNDGSNNVVPWKPFPGYSTIGYDTAETAQNIYSTINPQDNETALVELGNSQNQNDATPATMNESQTQPIINTPTYQQVYPPILISTDKRYYTNGDTITISGTLTPVIPGTVLTIELLNPNNNVITVEQIVPQQSLYHAIIVTGNVFWHSGTYTIKAQYGSPNISVWIPIDLSSTSPQIIPKSTPSSVPEFGTFTSVAFLIGIITTVAISTRFRSKMT